MPQARAMTALTYFKMKVERAKTHLDAFNAYTSEFLPKAITVTTEDDLERSLCIRRTEYHGFPPELGMELGECLYCLRSALDQMAWHLALPEARKLKPKLVCFPIVESVINSRQRKDWRQTFELFPPNVASEIDTLQPYQKGDAFKGHPLWQLNFLCNCDKHCIIPVNSRGAHVYIPPRGEVFLREDIDAIEVKVPLADKHYFDFDPQKTSSLELGEWNSDIVIPLEALAEIYRFFTEAIFPRFRELDRVVDTGGFPIRIGTPEPVYRR